MKRGFLIGDFVFIPVTMIGVIWMLGEGVRIEGNRLKKAREKEVNYADGQDDGNVAGEEGRQVSSIGSNR